jgi:hypothetical protein
LIEDSEVVFVFERNNEGILKPELRGSLLVQEEGKTHVIRENKKQQQQQQ